MSRLNILGTWILVAWAAPSLAEVSRALPSVTAISNRKLGELRVPDAPLHPAACAQSNAFEQQLLLLRFRGGSTLVAPSKFQGFLLLSFTIVLEVFATTSMKLATRSPYWNFGVFGGYITCFSIFPYVLRHLPLGVAYAIWSGMGTLLTTVISSVLFGEVMSPVKAFCLFLILAGVIGLNIVSGGH
mmetsp:Transcript_21108/g.66266  ORF Transcript_21108/g.66266 Transcript_21108/m.66266 type:complete len:186 (+) Transcript_21108:16-573(+)